MFPIACRLLCGITFDFLCIVVTCPFCFCHLNVAVGAYNAYWGLPVACKIRTYYFKISSDVRQVVWFLRSEPGSVSVPSLEACLLVY